jgi:hypothetical protein
MSGWVLTLPVYVPTALFASAVSSSDSPRGIAACELSAPDCGIERACEVQRPLGHLTSDREGACERSDIAGCAAVCPTTLNLRSSIR